MLKKYFERFIVVSIAIAFSILLMEICTTTYYFLKTDSLIWFRAKVDSVKINLSTDDTRQKLSPIYGYSLRPGFIPANIPTTSLEGFGYTKLPDFWYWPANNYGFMSKVDYPFEGNKNSYYVGVTGGSVANGFALEIKEQLINLVSEAANIPREAVQIINLAGGGFKQPQQALVVAYFSAIGQKFDLIINLDGLNEAYIGWDNSKRFGAEPALPSIQFIYGLMNNFLTANHGDKSSPALILEKISALEMLKTQTKSSLIYYYSTFVLSDLKKKLVKVELEMGLPVEGRIYPFMIQKRSFQSDNELADYLADVWVQGSINLSGLANQLGAAYIHGLQPNQYYGNRIFQSDEKKLAFSNPPWEGSQIVPMVYKKMLESKNKLHDKGIQFIDLTGVFDDERRQLYYDACCHFNHYGYEIILSGEFGRAIYSAVIKSQERKNKR